MRLIDADAMMKRLKAWDTNDTIDKALYNFALNRVLEAPTVELDTTTHDSIPAKTSKNDGDGTSGDCISRQQAIDALRKTQTYKMFAGDDMLLIDQAEAQTELMMLPSAQPERKTGRWIPCPQNASWLYVYKCSECGGYLQISDVDGNRRITAKYCSYCGAKMKEGEQE